MPDKPNIVLLDCEHFTSEDFSLSLPVLNLDGTPYDLTGALAKCTLAKIGGPGTLESFTFSTIVGNITISGNTLLLVADHSELTNMVGQYKGEVLLNTPVDIDIVIYVLRINSQLARTVNNSW